jgi:hypothetical protein
MTDGQMASQCDKGFNQLAGVDRDEQDYVGRAHTYKHTGQGAEVLTMGNP